MTPPRSYTAGAILVAALAPLVTAGASRAACDPVLAADVNEPLYRNSMWLYGGTQYVFETTNLSLGADPVMRLFNGFGELAVDDDSGTETNAAKITYTPGGSGWHTIVMHVGAPGAHGTASIEVNGSIPSGWENVHFGGASAWFGSVGGGGSCLATVSGDEVRTLHESVSNSVSQHQVLALNGAYLTAPAIGFQDTGWNEGEDAHADVTGGLSHVTAIFSSLQAPGRMGVAFNDTSDDADGDGLGHDLEVHLGSCPDQSTVLANGWDCDFYYASDSDNDGIPDYEEVFSYQHTTGSPYALRRWGADPAHRDVFVEVDWDSSVYQQPDDIATRLQAAPDGQGVAAALSARFRPAGEEVMPDRNPDGTPGVALHFDVSEAPFESPSENPVLLFDSGGSGPLSANACTPANLLNTRNANMARERRPFFRYWCAEKSGGGQARAGTVFFSTPDSVNLSAHELGHTLVDYNGHDSVKGPNGRVNWPSIMSYAFQNDDGQGFSLGDAESVVPAAIDESVGYSFRVVLAGNKYQFPNTDSMTGQVDWNRDDEFSGGTTPVRGVPHWVLQAPYAGARAIEGDRITVPSDTVAGTPAGVRYKATVGGTAHNRLYFFYVTSNNDVKYVYTTDLLGFPDDCPRAADGDWENGCLFPRTSPFNFGATGLSGPVDTGFDATALGAVDHVETGGSTTIYLALAQPDADLEVIGGIPATDGTIPFTSRQEYTSAAVTGAPDIASYRGNLKFVWREGTELWKANRNGCCSWTSRAKVQTNTGEHHHSNADPTLAVNPDNEFLYLLRTESDDHLDILYKSKNSDYWYHSGWHVPTSCTNLSGCGGPNVFETQKKPGFVYRTDNDSVNDKGAWEITFVRSATAWAGTLSTLHLTRRGESAQNVTAPTGTVATKPPSGIDAFTHADDADVHGLFVNGFGQLTLYPYLDGSPNRTFSDQDDFLSMSEGICNKMRHSSDGFQRVCGQWTPASSQAPVPDAGPTDCDFGTDAGP